MLPNVVFKLSHLKPEPDARNSSILVRNINFRNVLILSQNNQIMPNLFFSVG